MLEINKVYLGDCLEIMPKIDSSSIDMVIADLPYALTQNLWDNIIPLDQLWIEYKRIIKENGIIALTASQPFTSKLVMSNLEMFKHEWIWQKNRGGNFANTIREPFKEHESILIFSRGKWTYNKQMQERAENGKSRIKYDFNTITETTNYRKFEYAPESKGKELRVPSSIQKFNVEVGLHPTQKPVTLFEYLIKTYTNEGELVLDNVIGCGTTAIASLNLKRNFIGIEKDTNYYKIALDRIENHKQNDIVNTDNKK